MKKLLVGLLALGSISAFASCNVFLQSGTLDVEKGSLRKDISKLLKKKGYQMTESIADIAYTLNLEPVHYHYEGSAPNYFRPIGITSVFYSEDEHKKIASGHTEGFALFAKNRGHKLIKVSNKSVKRMLEQVKNCQE